MQEEDSPRRRDSLPVLPTSDSPPNASNSNRLARPHPNRARTSTSRTRQNTPLGASRAPIVRPAARSRLRVKVSPAQAASEKHAHSRTRSVSPAPSRSVSRDEASRLSVEHSPRNSSPYPRRGRHRTRLSLVSYSQTSQNSDNVAPASSASAIMRNRDNNGVATILANLQADLHLLKEKVAAHATSGDNKDDPIIQESLRHLQATQGCLRASQNTILKSSLPIVLPEEFSSEKTAFLERLLREAGMDRSGADAGLGGCHDSRLAEELARKKEEVAGLKKQMQVYADTAIQFQCQYNQLLDQLEEVGVHISTPGAPASSGSAPNGAGAASTGNDPLTSPQYNHTFGDGGTSRPIQSEESKLYEYSSTQSALINTHGSPRVAPRPAPEKGSDFYESSDEESDVDSEMESVAGPTELPQMTEEDVAAIQMSDSLRSAQEELPLLEGFLEKKSPSFGRGWQRRFVVVKGYNIFYGRSRVSISSDADLVASKKFLNGISLMVVDTILEIDEKGGRNSKKFQIKARDPRTGDMRAYIWRAATVEERDRWVEGLNQHLDLLQSIFRWAALNKNEHTRVDLNMSRIP